MAELTPHAAGLVILAVAALGYVAYESRIYVDVTTHQWYALAVGMTGACVYWYYLLLLTQAETIEISVTSLVGLVFAIIGSFLSWTRFVFTTAGHVG